jgi:hypothetical protein
MELSTNVLYMISRYCEALWEADMNEVFFELLAWS